MSPLAKQPAIAALETKTKPIARLTSRVAPSAREKRAIP